LSQWAIESLAQSLNYSMVESLNRLVTRHLSLSRSLTLFLLFVFSLTGCDGQRDARSFTYRLRNRQKNDRSSTLHTMPDGGLLVLSKRFEQPKEIWNLVSIAAWDTSEPREDKLDVDVGPNNEVLGWSLQADRYDRNDQLLMDPGGNYLVVRLSPDADTWDTAFDQPATPRTVLNIIDLHGFKLLRRVAITDPLLGAGDMGFSPTGTLVVSGLQQKSTATIDGKVTHSRRYVVETLALSDLKPAPVCSYTLVTRPYSTQEPSTPEVGKQIDKENQEETDREQNQKRAAEKACGPKLAPLGFSSLDDVQRSLTFIGRLQHDADYAERVPPQSPWGCQFEDLSGDLQYGLFDCDQGRVVVFGRYRAFRVFLLRDGKQVMDSKLPHRTLFSAGPQFSGVLATSRGVTYVVLLRDGVELEGYRVP
jgi:hypothetical protein